MQNNDTITVGLVSLGCPKNVVDLQIMCGAILVEGIELSADPDSADVILVNTCAFIEDARNEADTEIRRACELKAAGQARFVVVSGCLPQRYGKALAKKYPDVDAWLGIDHLFDLPEIIFHLVENGSGEKAVVRVSDCRNTLYDPPLPEFVLSGGTHAYLKIAEGCSHACAYCAIPAIRGKLRSRLVNDIVREAKKLLAAGYRELVIVGQDITAYGRDLEDGTTLAALLKKLDRIKGDFWIRLLYGYPTYVTDELLQVIASSKHICRYFDIPIQHSHPEVLKKMRRADTVKNVASLPTRLREASPEMAIRTTCMVGFPGETDEHFNEMLDYVEKAKFDQLGVFCFSPEEGTAAAKMDSAVPPSIAEKRRDRLMRAQQKIVASKLKSYIGQRLKVILIAPADSKNTWRARTEFQAPHIDGETFVVNVGKNAVSGDFVDVIVTDFDEYDLIAEVAK